jgi:D-tyrosyl-tRNA(Tyr) deacylase
MRLCIQRVSEASVSAEGRITGSIGQGLLVLLGVGRGDTRETADALSDKLVNLRIFGDAEGKMNLSIKDAGGAVLMVSQFTLYADTAKGNRPGFSEAAPPEQGKDLFEYFCQVIKNKLGRVETGVFGAHMRVRMVNDGPVTILLEK